MSKTADRARPMSREHAGDMPLAPVPLMDRRLVESDRVFLGDYETSRAARGDIPLDSPGLLAPKRDPISGLRQYLTPEQGRGYWDVFRLGRELFLLVADATYKSSTVLRVHDRSTFKLRVLLDGEIRAEGNHGALTGPSAVLTVIPDDADVSYEITGGIPLRMVVLTFTSEIALAAWSRLPEVLHPLTTRPATGSACPTLPIPMSPELHQAISEVLNSRLRFAEPLRRGYLYAKAIEVLTIAVQELEDRQSRDGGTHDLKPRDVRRIMEAREILLREYASPPTIPRLARLVGTNQTKLKAGFRHVFGLTIFDFIQKQRMERASKLLLQNEVSIAEISLAVGYTYPCNFTYAFKRYYGCGPKLYRRRASTRP